DAEVEKDRRTTSRFLRRQLRHAQDWRQLPVDTGKHFSSVDGFRHPLHDAARKSGSVNLAQRVWRLCIRRFAAVAAIDAIRSAGKGWRLHHFGRLSDRSRGQAERVASNEQSTAAVWRGSRGG